MMDRAHDSIFNDADWMDIQVMEIEETEIHEEDEEHEIDIETLEDEAPNIIDDTIEETD